MVSVFAVGNDSNPFTLPLVLSFLFPYQAMPVLKQAMSEGSQSVRSRTEHSLQVTFTGSRVGNPACALGVAGLCLEGSQQSEMHGCMSLPRCEGLSPAACGNLRLLF